MKKRQIGLLGLVVGQAITLFKKDAELREKVKNEPGLLGKAKVFGEKRLDDNKAIFADIKETDWEKTVSQIESDISYDTEKVKKRGEEQAGKDWEDEGRNAARKIVNSIPDKKTLADGVEKYKQRIIQWWDNL